MYDVGMTSQKLHLDGRKQILITQAYTGATWA